MKNRGPRIVSINVTSCEWRKTLAVKRGKKKRHVSGFQWRWTQEKHSEEAQEEWWTFGEEKSIAFISGSRRELKVHATRHHWRLQALCKWKAVACSSKILKKHLVCLPFFFLRCSQPTPSSSSSSFWAWHSRALRRWKRNDLNAKGGKKKRYNRVENDHSNRCGCFEEFEVKKKKVKASKKKRKEIQLARHATR